MLEGKDIIPTGYGFYSLTARGIIFVYFLSSEEDSSSIIVVSPVNALMQDQINKLRGYLNVRILKDDRDRAL